MGISTRQYQDIMNEYDAARRRNYMAEQERKERIYALIPRFAVLMRRLLMFLSQRQRRCF